ncbi:MAG: DUF1616 domain-containing protein [Conexivisphaerales archaeon]
MKGVLLAFILLLALIASAQYYYQHVTQEPFPELGILGPNQKIGDYPASLLEGQNFTLYLYVGNHEGKVMFFNVLVKLGNSSSIINNSTYLHTNPIASYQIVLLNNQTWLNPITLSINETGMNMKLVFELWDYNTTIQAFQYTGIWNQLYINVTGAA